MFNFVASYTASDEAWVELPRVGARSGHGCGTAVNPDTGRRELVVAGGQYGVGKNDSQIFDFEAMEWRGGECS